MADYKSAYTEYQKWLHFSSLDEASRKRLLELDGDEDAILERFAVPMQFGTAGLRSTMDVGISKMNVYTVAQTTKGLADLIIESDGQDKGAVVCYDSRNNSRLFAQTAASVLAANGIKVYLFDDIRPTPELSFAILHYGCIAGINITASHNPKEYNGYKVYWDDGAQLPPEHASVVSATVAKTDIFSVRTDRYPEMLQAGKIQLIGKETDRAYLDAVIGSGLSGDLVRAYGDSLHLVYTPLHGTGYRLVPACLQECGIRNLLVVDEQAIPDGNFPTVKSPNPENSECFELAIRKIEEENIPCNMILASDPDADRIGLALRGKDRKFFTLNGNQIGALLIDYIIRVRKEKNILPANGCAIKSIVSSNLFDAICEKEGVDHIHVLTGFKYIGEKIKQWAETNEHTFLFGYEESQGYLSAGYARDKDAVAGCMLVAEMASWHASHGKTVSEALDDIYARYGFYRESVVNVAIKGVDPMAKMAELMSSIRESKLSSIADIPVTSAVDYLHDETGLPKSDVLYYTLNNGDAVIIRPSGTEPKVKAYLLVRDSTDDAAMKKLETYREYMLQMLQA